MLFYPWKINKKFVISNRAYDSILIMFISTILYVIGFILWLVGMSGITYMIWQMITIGITDTLVSICGITVFALIISLVSCVVSIIALIKTYR